MVTILDVAKKANVALGTASRALHNNGYVSEKTRERVKQAAKQLGYVVNYNALLLRDKQSKNIGALISDINNPYFMNVVRDLQIRLSELGYGIILAMSNNSVEDEAKQLRYLIGNKVSTILFIPASSKNEEILMLAKNNHINVVQLFIQVYEEYNSIVNDDEQGTFLAASQLISEGYKRIALFDIDYSAELFDKEVFPCRSLGLEKITKSHKEIKTLVLRNSPYEDLTKKNLEKLEDFAPDAIIAGTGVFGLKVLKFLKTNSLKAKIVTFDDNDWFAFQGITSIRQNETDLIEHIISQITNKDVNDIAHFKVDENITIRND